MAVIPEVAVSQAGAITAARAAAAGDTIVPGDAVDLVVKNGAAAAVTVTVVGKTACNHGTIHNLSVTIAAGVEKVIGPISPGRFADQATGLATVNYSDPTSVTVYSLRS